MAAKTSLSDYTEDEFIRLIKAIDDAASEAEQGELVEKFNRVVPHPAGSDLLFYPEPGADDSPEGVVVVIKEWCRANGQPGFADTNPV